MKKYLECTTCLFMLCTFRLKYFYSICIDALKKKRNVTVWYSEALTKTCCIKEWKLRSWTADQRALRIKPKMPRIAATSWSLMFNLFSISSITRYCFFFFFLWWRAIMMLNTSILDKSVLATNGQCSLSDKAYPMHKGLLYIIRWTCSCYFV